MGMLRLFYPMPTDDNNSLTFTHMNHTEPNHKHFVILIITISIGAFLTVMMLSACSVSRLTRKADKAIVKLYEKDSVKADKTVSKYLDLAPVKTVDTIVIDGEPIVTSDTIIQTQIYTRNDTVFISKVLFIHDSVTTPIYTYITDHERITIHSGDILARKLQTQVDTLQSKLSGRTWYIWTTWIFFAVIACAIVWYIKNLAENKAFELSAKMKRNG